MKTTFWRLAALLAVTVLGTGGLLRADDVQLTANYDEVAGPADNSVAYATDAVRIQAQPPAEGIAPGTASVPGDPSAPGDEGERCNQCGHCNACCGCKPWGPYSEPCPRITAYAFTGVDSFRGVTNGTFPNNDGGLTGLNLGGALWEEAGIGWQVGGTYGIYNFDGTSSPGSRTNSDTQQGFLTVGFFRRANVDRRLSWGVVQDWMFSSNFGAFGNSPTLGQVRVQIAWAVGPKNEFGLWSTIQDRSVTRATGALGTPVAYQAIDQGNLFWHHKYGAYGADSWAYIGIPLDGRIATPANSAGFPVGGSGGSLGSFIVGTNWLIPINDRLSGYADVMYMRPSAAEGVVPGPTAAQAQAFWNVSAGIAFYPGRTARSQTVAGRQWMPYMPVANNGSFLVDATKTE